MIKITGELVQKLEFKQISDKFSFQEFVIKTESQYPKKVCLQAASIDIDILQNIPLGSKVECTYNPESRESNGRWYTTLKCIYIAKID